MRDTLLLVLHLFLTIIRLLLPGGARKIAAENVVLRQQLQVVRRKQKRAPKLLGIDRFIFGFFASMLCVSRFEKVCVIIKPSTLLRFHQVLVKRKYNLLYSPKKKAKPGPKGPSQDVIDLVLEMKRRNPRFGYRRIAMQVSYVLNIEVDQFTVRRILQKNCKYSSRNDGPSWLSFLGSMKDSLWSVDLFRCESILLKSHWVMVVMDQFTRRIIGYAVCAGSVDGITLCCMFNKAISGKMSPSYLSSDNDPLFQFHRWRSNLRVLEIEEIKTLPYAPMSHPFIERLIGTIRREYLDQTLFWNRADLQKKLAKYIDYYNRQRCHWSLQGETPKHMAENKRRVVNSAKFIWQDHCNGLYRLPVAV